MTFEQLTEEQKARLFSIYQIIEHFAEAEEDELPEEQELNWDEAFVLRAIPYVMDTAAERNEELFKHELVTRSEVLDAFLHGPRIMQEFYEHLAATTNAMLEKWETEFPECKTFGDVVEASRSAGRA